MDESPSGGAFSGTVACPADRYTVEARFASAGASDSVTDVAVGEVFAAWGQSNMQGVMDDPLVYDGALGAAIYDDETAAWQDLTTGWQDPARATPTTTT